MTGQNTSSAVMAQRQNSFDSADDFPTPPYATRALLEYLAQFGCWSRGTLGGSAWDPAANRGHMVRVLVEYFSQVRASDLHDYGAGFAIEDFRLPLGGDPVDWIISNPPFNLGIEFIERALHAARYGVAMLVRTQFLAGMSRYRDLFSMRPPQYILQFAERVVMLEGRLVRAGAVDLMGKRSNKTGKLPKASTATDYLWLVWASEEFYEFAPEPIEFPHKLFDWIPPCRLKLEKPGDYPEVPDGLAAFDRERLVA